MSGWRLVDRIVNDLRGQPYRLSTLQMVLDALWQRLPVDGMLRGQGQRQAAPQGSLTARSKIPSKSLTKLALNMINGLVVDHATRPLNCGPTLRGRRDSNPQPSDP
jgi:hypothetical protein